MYIDQRWVTPSNRGRLLWKKVLIAKYSHGATVHLVRLFLLLLIILNILF